MDYMPTLLVVEDDDDVRETLVDALYSLNAEKIIAENGLRGLEQVELHKPDAIITDINMPKMNGLEMIRNIRQRGYETPIIVLSAFGDRVNTVEALRLGAMDFLDKPCNIDQLLTTAQKALDLGMKVKSFEAEWRKHIEEQYKDKNLPEAILDSKKEIFRLRFFGKSTDKKTA